MLLVMLELMLSFSPLGFILIKPISITTAHLPVMIGALWGAYKVFNSKRFGDLYRE